METKEEKKNCCAICGAEYEEPAQPKTTDGLNLMTSVKVRMMVRFCTRCGYVNHSVSMEPPKGVDMAWLQSDAFRSCDGIRFKHEFASRSYQFHMVRLADQDYRGAMLAVSLAAQICEETGDDENAETCLKKAAELAQKQYQSDSDPMMLAMWCEYLRRSGQFETVLEVTEQEDLSDAPQFIRSVIEYQRKGARAHDKSVMMLRANPPENEENLILNNRD